MSQEFFHSRDKSRNSNAVRMRKELLRKDNLPVPIG